MEIKASMNVSGVNGPTPPPKPAPSSKPASDSASFARSEAVNAALQNLPASRPEAVARAQQLINDPNYPSSGMVKQLSQFLTTNLTVQSL